MIVKPSLLVIYNMYLFSIKKLNKSLKIFFSNICAYKYFISLQYLWNCIRNTIPRPHFGKSFASMSHVCKIMRPISTPRGCGATPATYSDIINNLVRSPLHPSVWQFLQSNGWLLVQTTDQDNFLKCIKKHSTILSAKGVQNTFR